MRTLTLSALLAVAVLATPDFKPALAQQGIQDFGLEALAGDDPEGQFQLGLRYFTGKGFRQDAREGLRWLEKAAAQGHAKAMLVIGSIYEDGEEEAGIKPDAKVAASWYQKAADLNLPEAQHQLGLLYAMGKGFKTDLPTASKWFQKAAAQGHIGSQNAYAGMLIEGEGVTRNPAKAALWYLRAAKQDNSYAQRKLANLYFAGLGVPVDYLRCEAWYRRAVTNGDDPWAKNDLAWFLSTCPDASFHKGKEAAKLAKDAVKQIQDLDKGGDFRHEVVDTVAASLARNGQYDEAVIWQREAIKLVSNDENLTPEGRKQLGAEFQTRLSLYLAKKPYADPAPKVDTPGDPLPNDSVLDDASKPKLKPEADDGENKGDKSGKPRTNVT